MGNTSFLVQHQSTEGITTLQFNGHFPGGPGLAGTTMSPFLILLELRMIEVMVTTGAIRRAKPQSNRHHQQTNIQFLQSGCTSCHPADNVATLKELKRWNSILCMWTAWYCFWLCCCSSVKCGICVVCCEIVFIIRLGVGLLVVVIWLELCTTYSWGAVTTTSNILCFNKHRFTQVHLENGRWNGERCWPVSEHVCLLVGRIMQKLFDRVSQNLVDWWHMSQERNH